MGNEERIVVLSWSNRESKADKRETPEPLADRAFCYHQSGCSQKPLIQKRDVGPHHPESAHEFFVHSAWYEGVASSVGKRLCVSRHHLRRGPQSMSVWHSMVVTLSVVSPWASCPTVETQLGGVYVLWMPRMGSLLGSTMVILS